MRTFVLDAPAPKELVKPTSIDGIREVAEWHSNGVRDDSASPHRWRVALVRDAGNRRLPAGGGIHLECSFAVFLKTPSPNGAGKALPFGDGIDPSGCNLLLFVDGDARRRVVEAVHAAVVEALPGLANIEHSFGVKNSPSSNQPVFFDSKNRCDTQGVRIEVYQLFGRNLEDSFRRRQPEG